MPNKNKISSKKTSANAGKLQQASQSQSTQSQHTSAQPAGQHQQGQAPGHVGGQYGQPAATQAAQGTSLGGNTPQNQSATSVPQYPQQLKWRNAFTPSKQQGAMGQGGSSSTSASGLGAGAGAYGSKFHTVFFGYYSGGGTPPNRGTRGAKPCKASHDG